MGDAIAEDDGVGYWQTMLISVGIIAAAFLFDLLTNALLPPRTWYSILAFWVAYVATRPLGASVGDFLTQDPTPTFGGDCFDSADNATCDAGDDSCTVRVPVLPIFLWFSTEIRAEH